ncbi:MAG TPA: CbiX/SirB N-terminal domain-containing protein [Streptosporangiaceae bacterium]|nr:CbiX/SirB N-terminal domain-containing protein [Streptosporangiaceae bacterium]
MRPQTQRGQGQWALDQREPRNVAGQPVPDRDGPVLLAVAHGSRDPAAQQCVHALTKRVRWLARGTRVRAAFVSHARPLLADALVQAVADAGTDGVVLVPLLLSTGYHLSVDIGNAALQAGVAAAGPLGPSPGLVPALADRLAETGAPPGTPVVLAAAGSSDPRAATDTAQQAALLAAHLRAPVVPAFATAAKPSVTEAVAALAARTGHPVAVASYLLAPGLFQDRLHETGAAWVSAPLGDHPAVAAVVAGRFHGAGSLLTGDTAA